MAHSKVSEYLDKYMEQESLYRLEGRPGLITLCTIADALGYKDPQHFGQLTSKAQIGDLLEMLQDNSGMIEAMLEWVRKQHSSEWEESLKSQLNATEGQGWFTGEESDGFLIHKGPFETVDEAEKNLRRGETIGYGRVNPCNHSRLEEMDAPE